MEFMEICEKAQAEVLCLDEMEDAGRIFQRIQKFIVAYFEGSVISLENTKNTLAV